MTTFDIASPPPAGIHWQNGVLHADAVPLDQLAAQVATPFYCYAGGQLTAAYTRFAQAMAPIGARICYAVKANGNLSVLRTLARLGCGADVVSGGELTRALAAGIPADRIVFSGVGKTVEELRFAVEQCVHQINVESVGELSVLQAVAAEVGPDKAGRVAVALRVNPDVEAGTHPKISTGRKGDKFGIAWQTAMQLYQEADRWPALALVGLAMHIGSQIVDEEAYRRAFLRMRQLVLTLREAGCRVERLDLGGGLGVDYGGPSRGMLAPERFVTLVDDTLGGLGCALTVEPGRALVAEAGVLVSRVLYVKRGEETGGRPVVVVDVGMNDLMRPALYDAWHAITPARESATPRPMVACDVVGPICESTDTFARARELPLPAPGELLVFHTAGAYGASLSSTYNARPLIPEVLVEGGQTAVVRSRVPTEAWMQFEPLAPWLESTS